MDKVRTRLLNALAKVHSPEVQDSWTRTVDPSLSSDSDLILEILSLEVENDQT